MPGNRQPRISNNGPGACFRRCASAATTRKCRDANPQVIIALPVTRDGMPQGRRQPGSQGGLGRRRRAAHPAMCCASPPRKPSVSGSTVRRVLAERLDAELGLLDKHEDDHSKAACALVVSRRYGRYLNPDRRGWPKMDAANVKAAEKSDGKFVLITNDETLPEEDVALAYRAGAMIECCFRRMQQTGLELRPMYHWMPQRIEAQVKQCVLALYVQRAAEIREGLPWPRIAQMLSVMKAERYRSKSRTSPVGQEACRRPGGNFGWRSPGGPGRRPIPDRRPYGDSWLPDTSPRPSPRFAMICSAFMGALPLRPRLDIRRPSSVTRDEGRFRDLL
jgi:hypothetical protein